MYDNFNYEESLNRIKASLYDIYENQEKLVGAIEDENERNEHVSNYIEVKNIALELVEKITNLYRNHNNSYVKMQDNQDNNIVIQQSVEEVGADNLITQQSEEEIEDDNLISEQGVEDVQEEDNPAIQQNIEDNQDDNPIVEENIEDTPQIIPIESSDEESVDSIQQTDDDEVATSNDLEEFYFDDRNGTKANFAYVPKNIYLKLKNGVNIQQEENEIVEESDNLFYKSDTNSPKGIIVRTDQYMKLSLSKHRQEGVLREAKQFRINEAKKAREKLKVIDENN